MSTTDRIEKSIALKVPPARVWRALTDHVEFGTWFRAALEGPFVPGQYVRGNITYPGYEHLRFAALVKAMEPERYFAFTWHPYAVDTARDYSQETPTLVEFTLTPNEGGTVLRVVERGFDALPPDRRADAFRMNSNGWSIQMENICNHVSPPA